jgi:hypothetical protein
MIAWISAHIGIYCFAMGVITGWNIRYIYVYYRNRKNMNRIWKEIQDEINKKAEHDIFEDRLN